MLKKIVPAFAAIMIAAPALAADLPSRKEAPVYIAPVPMFSWTGFYIGADIGGGWSELNAKPYDVFGNNLGSFNTSSAGVVGGGRIGYNYQFNQFIIGVEGDFYGTGIGKTVYYPAIDSSVKTNQDWLASVNGVAGFAIDRTMLYVIGGVAWAGTSATWTPGATWAVNTPSYSVNHTYTGYDIGGGVQYAFTPNWIGRVEYRHYGFGSWNYPSNYLAQRTGATLNNNIFTVGASYKFGGPVAAPVVAKY
ncbi:outer membrane immunogenic protein [Rhodoblastus acidophilus]|nr:outer membrane protein [Rhodoblastus acidophilus]MCW2273456.1 outer membrane immunogenic protein [Rhodoblastus acidophilus]